MQRLIIVRCLRPDRIVFATTSFIVNNLGSRFTEPPVLDLGSVLADSAPSTPLVFVLSPGSDPTNQLQQLAEAKGVTFNTIALGQGQAPHALALIDRGIVDGDWVLLANCHLMMSWLGELDKIIEGLPARQTHASFRLWLSSSPHPKFPIGILQRGIKMTTEPPKGLKANMTRLVNNIPESKFSACTKPLKYKKLLYAMCWLHSVLVDRRKFGDLGWNIPYDFNDSDFEVSIAEIIAEMRIDADGMRVCRTIDSRRFDLGDSISEIQSRPFIAGVRALPSAVSRRVRRDAVGRAALSDRRDQLRRARHRRLGPSIDECVHGPGALRLKLALAHWPCRHALTHPIFSLFDSHVLNTSARDDTPNPFDIPLLLHRSSSPTTRSMCLATASRRCRPTSCPTTDLSTRTARSVRPCSLESNSYREVSKSV